MSRDIITEEEGFRIVVNTFWSGSKGESVQITPLYGTYTIMTRTEAIEFLELASKRLKQQIKQDKKKPPWWQKIYKTTNRGL